MKVVFFIKTAAQFAAVDIVSELAKEVTEIAADDKRIDSSVSIDLTGNIVTIEGNRRPVVLICHELFAELKKSNVRPIEYDTEDMRLRWDETVKLYVERRGSFAEALNWLTNCSPEEKKQWERISALRPVAIIITNLLRGKTADDLKDLYPEVQIKMAADIFGAL